MAETVETDLVEFRMPSLGSDMDSGTVIAWRVAEGDTVAKGDVLLDVDTDKSEIEVEVWHDARVEHILVGPGETVAVGTPIARLAVGASAERPTSPAAPGEPAAVTESAAAPPHTDAPPPGVSDRRPGATAPMAASDRPDARREAAKTGPPAAAARATRSEGQPTPLVTPRTVYWPTSVPVPRANDGQDRRTDTDTGTDTGGDAAAAAPARPARRQNVVAAAMEQSNREIPHFHLTTEIDLAPTIDWLEAANDARRPPERILTAAIFLRAVALTVARHPTFNGTWTDGRFVPADTVALGVAIHMRDGTLMTPVIADADQLRLDDLMASFRAVVGRTRSGGLKASDIAQPTITVTNLGDSGADSVAGLIRPPQVALVGFGRVRPRPVAIDDAVVVRPTVQATLSADHRANNGQAAAAFLTSLVALVRSPDQL